MNSFTQFLQWERASRDTIDFKKIYVDIAGDLNAGLMLSEIVYWYLPNKDNQSRLRIERDNHMWLAIRRTEWWDRTRMSPDQADRALKILIEAGIVVKKRYKFAGDIAIHVRLVESVFMQKWTHAIENPAVNPYEPTELELGKKAKSNLAKVENPIPTKPQILLTETTAKTTNNIPLTPKGGKGRKRKTELPDHATWLANEYAPHRALAEALRTPFMSLDVPPENSTRASLMPYLDAARELSALGASAEDAAKLYSYVKKRAADEQWKVRFGVNALLKHYPEWRAQQQRKAKQATAAAQSAPPQVPILLLDYDAPEGNPPGAREVAS